MAWVLIATDDFVHLKRGFARSMAAGSREAIKKAKPPPASAATSLSTVGMTHEANAILIACPLAPEEFLKQFAAFLREHAAVDITAMI